MTEPARGSQVDWDLLADHLGGALTGTPEGERVARLVEADPQWRRAAADLSAALGAVAADLRALPASPMPAEVSARLESALRAEITGDVPATGSPVPAPRGDAHSALRGAITSDPPATGGPAAPRGDAHSALRGAITSDLPATGGPVPPRGDGRPERGRSATAPRRPPRRAGRHRGRRRVARWGAGLAVAAGVVMATVVGFAVWGPGSPYQAADEDRPEELARAPSTPSEDPSVVATGINYRPEGLDVGRPGEAPSLTSEGAGPAAESDLRQRDQDAVPAELDRLWTDPVALSECLALVEAALAPATVELVDFAHFQGEPALVIWVTTAADERWAWISGPECGTAAGADEQFRTRLP